MLDIYFHRNNGVPNVKERISTAACWVLVGVGLSAMCIFLLECKRSHLGGKSVGSDKFHRLIRGSGESPRLIRFASDDAPWIVAIDAQGNKWVGTKFGDVTRLGADGSVMQWDLNRAGLNQGKSVTAIRFDTFGNLWVCTDGSGILKYDGKVWSSYTTENSGLPNNNVWGIVFDENGVVWIVTEFKGLVRFNGTNWTVYNSTNSPLPEEVIINTMDLDARGNLWLGTYEDGLIRYDRKQEWKFYNTENSAIPENFVWTLVCDKEGSVWVGTGSAGVARLKGNNWTVFSQKFANFPPFVWHLAVDPNGVLWVAADYHGLLKVDGSQMMVFHEHNSNLPLSLATGLLCVTGVAVDNEGVKWVGVDGALVAFRETDVPGQMSQVRTVDIPEPGQRSTFVSDFVRFNSARSRLATVVEDKSSDLEVRMMSLAGLVSFMLSDLIATNTVDPKNINWLKRELAETDSEDLRCKIRLGVSLLERQVAKSIEAVHEGYKSKPQLSWNDLLSMTQFAAIMTPSIRLAAIEAVEELSKNLTVKEDDPEAVSWRGYLMKTIQGYRRSLQRMGYSSTLKQQRDLMNSVQQGSVWNAHRESDFVKLLESLQGTIRRGEVYDTEVLNEAMRLARTRKIDTPALREAALETIDAIKEIWEESWDMARGVRLFQPTIESVGEFERLARWKDQSVSTSARETLQHLRHGAYDSSREVNVPKGFRYRVTIPPEVQEAAAEALERIEAIP
jgi:streptogramin lyase